MINTKSKQLPTEEETYLNIYSKELKNLVL